MMLRCMAIRRERGYTTAAAVRGNGSLGAAPTGFGVSEIHHKRNVVGQAGVDPVLLRPDADVLQSRQPFFGDECVVDVVGLLPCSAPVQRLDALGALGLTEVVVVGASQARPLGRVQGCGIPRSSRCSMRLPAGGWTVETP